MNKLIKFILLFLIQISFLISVPPRMDLVEVDRKLGIASFNNAIEFNNQVLFLGNSATIVSHNSEMDNSVVEYGDYDANFDIHCGTVYSEILYTFGSNGNAWKFDSEFTPEKFSTSDTSLIVNAQTIGSKLYLLNSSGKLYTSNFENFELDLVDSNVSDISKYGDELLFLQNNKLYSLNNNSSEINERITFDNAVSKLAVKPNNIVVYSDSHYIYKYNYTQNSMDDISIKNTAYVETLDIAEDGTVVGISVENEYIIESFIGNTEVANWKYNNSTNNYITKIHIFGEKIYGLLNSYIKLLPLSDSVKNSTVEFTDAFIYQGLDYRTQIIINHKNKPYSVRDFLEYYEIAEVGNFENILTTIKSDYFDLGYNINIHYMYSDYDNIYLISDTTFFKEKKKIFILEKINTKGEKTTLVALDTVSTNSLLFPNIQINDKYVLFVKNNRINWSIDQGDTWSSKTIENTEFVSILSIKDDFVYYEYKAEDGLYQFGMYDIVNNENILLSKKPSFGRRFIVKDNGTLVGLVNPDNPEPKNDITDKVIYFSNDNGVSWDSTFIFSNLTAPKEFILHEGELYLFFTNRVLVFSDDLRKFNDFRIKFEGSWIEKHFAAVTDLYFKSFTVIGDSIFSCKIGQSVTVQGKITKSLTSVDDIGEPSSISSYPQPASNNLNIDLDESWVADNISVTIYSADGKLINSSDDISISTNSITWDCSKRIKGVYFIEISNSKKSEVVKVAVE